MSAYSAIGGGTRGQPEADDALRPAPDCRVTAADEYCRLTSWVRRRTDLAVLRDARREGRSADAT